MDDTHDDQKPHGATAGDTAPAAGEASLFGDDLPAPNAPYRVLARKYRPATFDDLIGQDPMVRTLRNAFSAGRVAQAWMLTGVRGVGKTTTARILARALNYRTDEVDAPTIDMPVLGEHCAAIMESRHMDVIEMDAASHTGIDDIREITDAARYMPASARYKVYIIDEVHMLSKAAFNGLLKTLEEPPPHVKFVFATTEIRKVPVTILSRCQRFDLRRIEHDVLAAHLASICEKEAVSAENEALLAITRAAEGSVRDALSLLDQAIAHGDGVVKAEGVADMLGLANQGLLFDLFEHLMAGRAADALTLAAEMVRDGADPAVLITDLAAYCHRVTEAVVVPDFQRRGEDQETGERASALAARVGVGLLSRTWQILLKGLEETERAPRPQAAADMVLIRVAYAAQMPPPDKLLERWQAATGDAPAPVEKAVQPDTPPEPTARLAPPPEPPVAIAPEGLDVPAEVEIPPAAPDPTPFDPPRRVQEQPDPRSFEEVVALARSHREITLVLALDRHARLVRFEPGRIEIAPTEDAPTTLASDLAQKLAKWTGRRWMVAVSREEGAPTLHERKLAAIAAEKQEAAKDPLVRSVLDTFPGAEILRIDHIDPTSLDDGSLYGDPPDTGPLDDGPPWIGEVADDESRSQAYGARHESDGKPRDAANGNDRRAKDNG